MLLVPVPAAAIVRSIDAYEITYLQAAACTLELLLHAQATLLLCGQLALTFSQPGLVLPDLFF
jgi:hypothetical protein